MNTSPTNGLIGQWLGRGFRGGALVGALVGITHAPNFEVALSQVGPFGLRGLCVGLGIGFCIGVADVVLTSWSGP